MDFRNGKMPRSRVDTAYAAISTVKVAHLLQSTELKLINKKSEISRFGLVNDVSVRNMQPRFTGYYIPRIPSVFRNRGKSLALLRPLPHTSLY